MKLQKLLNTISRPLIFILVTLALSSVFTFGMNVISNKIVDKEIEKYKLSLIEQAYAEPEQDKEDLQISDTEDIFLLEKLANAEFERMDYATQMLDMANKLGFEQDHNIIQTVKQEYENASARYEIYNTRYEKIFNEFYQPKMDEYPIATTVWLRLRSAGLSERQSAAIIGNMMAEVGGQTLNLSETLWNSSKSYYGLCQWSRKYYPDVSGKDLEFQIQFLLDTMDKYLGDGFYEAANESDAAINFAKYYERCSKASYSVRGTNATKALNYFIVPATDATTESQK